MNNGLFACLAAVLTASAVEAANLVANGDFSRCENGRLPPECRAEDGVSVSLFTEDLTWNRCLKATVSREYTNATSGVVQWCGQVFMGEKGQLGFPVEPAKNYDVAVDLRGTCGNRVRVSVTFWKGACRKWEDRVVVPVGEGTVRPGAEWKTHRGMVRSPEGAKRAAVTVSFCGSTQKGCNRNRIGDWILADNFSCALSLKNLGSSSEAAVEVPPRKAIATGDATPVDGFYNLKKAVPSDVPTTVRASADAGALVLDFAAEEPLAVVTGSADKVWSGDSLEFFVVNADGRLRHFAFNLPGAQYADLGDGKDVGGAGWTVSSERTANGFRATARVPFALLGFSAPPKAGACVRFNAGRNRVTAKEFLGWVKSDGGYGHVASFGTLFFGTWSEAFAAEFGETRTLATRDEYLKVCREIESARLREQFAKFRDRKFSVAVLPVVSDYSCPFLPDEVFDPTTNIHLVAAVNEVKALPLAVANLTDRLEDCLVMLETEKNEYIGDFGLKGFPAGQIKIRRAARMRDAADDTPTMRFDPLLPAEEACVLSVPPREAALVWFDFDTTDVKPGTYAGRLRIVPLGEEGRFSQRPGGGYHDRDYSGKMQTIPVALEVQPVVLPRRSPVTTGFYMHTPNEEAFDFAADLGTEHHQISPWRFPVEGDSPEVNARIAQERAWAAKRGFRPKFDILYTAYYERLGGKTNPERANKVWVPYLRNVKRIMNANGVPDEDYWIETLDEPQAKDLKVLIAAHRLAKAAVPSVRLCVTIGAWELPEADMRELAQVTDVFVFWGRSYFTGGWKKRLADDFRARGGTVCHYMCDTSMRMPLDTYFRHHAWIGERYRLDGNYFYEFSKLVKYFGATDFKELTGGDIVYYAFGRLVPSIRACAFREGITDIKYLAALRAAAGDDPEVKAFLDRAAKEVLEVTPRDPTTPDRLRERARELLLKHAVLPEASVERGGVTFDFDAISARAFGAADANANLVPSGKWNPSCHIHTYDLRDDDQMRAAVRRGITWSETNGVLRIVKSPELLACCNGKTNFVRRTDGSFKRTVVLPDGAGGRFRLRFRYRLVQPDEGLKGRASVLVTPLAGTGDADKWHETARGGIRSFWMNALPGDWPLFCKTFAVPEGKNAFELWIRLDGVGELAFRDISVERQPEKDLEIRVMTHGSLDGTYALARNQPNYLAIEWRKSSKLSVAPSKFAFRLELPEGVRYLGSNFADVKSVRTERRLGGGSVVRFRLRKGRVLGRSFNSDRAFGLVLETDRPNGALGEGRLVVEGGGRELGATDPVRFLATDPIGPTPLPQHFDNGFFAGAGIEGLFLDFDDDALVARYARFLVDAGCTWLLDHPKPAARAALRAAGFRRLLAETGRVSNGYHIGNMETAPADERFVPWRDKGSGGFGNAYVTNSACPVSIYREKPFFVAKSLPWIRSFAEGFDGMWGNWEPSMFGGGCACASCRDEFAAFAGLDRAALANWPACVHEPGNPFAAKYTAFLSWQHGQVVRTLDRHIRAMTGGKDSLGFMPGMAWLEVGSWWRPHNHAAEWLVKDYADALEWIEPWGPYDAWEVDSPWVYEKRKPLAVFRAARDVRRTVDADYPAGRRPKLASFPQGVQGGPWLTQPERLSMALDGFFFNGWQANIVYFFPRGCDARYWRGFANATARAARYEDFVRNGRRVDAAAVPVPGTYAVRCPRPTAFLPHDEDVSLLQTVAYGKDGARIVAVFNFWEEGEAFFDLRTAGLAKGRYTVVSEDGVLWVKSARETVWTDEELAAGIRLAVGAARTKVFEIRPCGGVSRPKTGKVLTRERLDEIFKAREPALREETRRDAERARTTPLPAEAWSPVI